jgi:tetratricopeptide (TPR) repeat protein
MGYWTYYLAAFALTFALQRPWVMVSVILFVILRPVLPDPVVLLRTWGKIRRLDGEIAANPANVRARRDLAVLWLERLRPGRALELLDEARKRVPDDAELLYLTGIARLRSGDAEGALEPLVKCVELDAKFRLGDPYLAAAEALLVLNRLEEAEDAAERFVSANGSSMQGYVVLADIRMRREDRAGARKALDEALETWRQLPSFYKRRGGLRFWLEVHAKRFWY